MNRSWHKTKVVVIQTTWLISIHIRGSIVNSSPWLWDTLHVRSFFSQTLLHAVIHLYRAFKLAFFYKFKWNMCGRKCVLNVLHDCPICIIRTTTTRTGQLDVLKADYGCRTKMILPAHYFTESVRTISSQLLSKYWMLTLSSGLSFLYPNIVCHVATLYQTSSRFNFDI